MLITLKAIEHEGYKCPIIRIQAYSFGQKIMVEFVPYSPEVYDVHKFDTLRKEISQEEFINLPDLVWNIEEVSE